MKRRRVCFALAASLVVMAAGCSSAPAEPAETPPVSAQPRSPASSSPSSAGVIYFPNVEGLRDALESAGIPCGQWEKDADREAGTCDRVGALDVSSSAEDAAAFVAKIKAEPTWAFPLVYNGNWVIALAESKAELLDPIQAELGGATYVNPDAPSSEVSALNTLGPDEDDERDEPELTTGQENAVGKAEEYLANSHFSKSGLVAQLRYEGFSKRDATFAVEHIDVSWKKQAAGKAKEYLDASHFSRSGLIAQLRYEGFTQSQAEYGVKKVGL